MRGVVLAALLFFAGCSVKEPGPYRYVSLEQCEVAQPRDMGVGEVELPDYFVDRRFVYKEGEGLGYLEDRIARDLQEFLTRCAAKELGGCAYPWECDKKPKKVVKIRIDEYYYDKDRGAVVLVLDADAETVRVEEPVRGDVITAALRAYKKAIAQIGR
jgi:hypothetical protein